MAITTILFDVGGVLVAPLDEEAVWARREQIAQRLGYPSGEEMWLAFYTSEAWEAAKTGGLGHEEMWEELLVPHGYVTAQERARFVEELHEGEGMPPAMEPLLATLTEQYRMGILSNWDERLEIILQELQIDRYFDIILNSYRIGMAKPDEAAFRLALQRLEAQPEEVFFIDDMERNTKAAEALGINTHHYTNLPALIADLEERSLLNGELDMGG